MTDERKFGKVKHWNANSAYGFFAEDGCSKQHFFRVRDIVTPGVDGLPLGQSVEFELGINDYRGPHPRFSQMSASAPALEHCSRCPQGNIRNLT